MGAVPGSAEEVEKLCGLFHHFSTDIGIEFGMYKCAVLDTRNGVKVKSEGVTRRGCTRRGR